MTCRLSGQSRLSQAVRSGRFMSSRPRSGLPARHEVRSPLRDSARRAALFQSVVRVRGALLIGFVQRLEILVAQVFRSGDLVAGAVQFDDQLVELDLER